MSTEAQGENGIETCLHAERTIDDGSIHLTLNDDAAVLMSFAIMDTFPATNRTCQRHTLVERLGSESCMLSEIAPNQEVSNHACITTCSNEHNQKAKDSTFSLMTRKLEPGKWRVDSQFICDLVKLCLGGISGLDLEYLLSLRLDKKR